LSYKSVGSFGKFADSPYYSESELCGGAVTVSFSNKVNPRTFQTAFVNSRIVFAVEKCFVLQLQV